MYILLGKVAAPLAAPLGMVLGLWVLALVCGLSGRRGAACTLAVAGIGALLVLASPLVGDRLLGGLEDDYPISSVGELPAADAVVVLGGMTDAPVPPRREVDVGAAFDRLLHGMRLLRAGRGRYLVLSGGVIALLEGSNMTEAARLAGLAAEYGVPPEAMLLEERSRNTYENALYTRALLAERGLGRVLLVTSAAHMRRAVAAFVAQGVEVVPAPTDVCVVRRPFTPARLIPDVQGLEYSTVAVKEHVGWWTYRLRGWVR
ncbi:MAG: YdcF family protein [Candidatus Latescibacterota bacterium]